MGDVTIHRILHAADATDAASFGTGGFGNFTEHDFFNRDLRLVIELAAIAVDKLDAVVLERIVRSTDDHAKISSHLGG